MWNERYSSKEYAYGIEPNEYIREKLEETNNGKILFPAEGEGRNSVYAAKLGWQTAAFDSSVVGREKALKLAEDNNVSIDYQVNDFANIEYQKEEFDIIAFTYVHTPANMRPKVHKKLSSYLKPGGKVILEGFSKANFNINSDKGPTNGPKDINMLFSIEEIKSDFSNFDTIELKEEFLELEEGEFHTGKSAVIRFVGVKK